MPFQNQNHKKFWSLTQAALLATGFASMLSLECIHAQAGVFSTPRFVQTGEYAIGLEPELTLTNGSGLGGNLRYTQGLSDLSNVTALIGTGGGPRGFRIGGNMTFDLFPDIEGQPGIGIAAQGIYYRLATIGQFELTAVPYIHKTFISGKEGKSEIEPFFAFPFGIAFFSGNYQAISNAVIGAIFKNSDHFRTVLEIGVNVNRSDSYVSGGLVYYH